MKRRAARGFSLIEILIVLAISVVLAGMAIPIFVNATNAYYQSATVSAATGAIESTRYAAIMNGCPYQLVFTSSTLSFQVYSEVPPLGTTSGCLASFAAVGSAVTPLPSAGSVTMNGATTFTYTFCANGTVYGAATTCPGSNLPPTMQISNKVKSSTITVSGVGNVSTSSP